MISPKILVIEDDKIPALDISNSLRKFGYTVLQSTQSGIKALQKVAETNPSLVLIDICLLGEINDLQVVNVIQNTFHIPVLYLMDYSEVKKINNHQFKEPFSYIPKPFVEQDLHTAVEKALYQHQMEKSLQVERQRMKAIINSMGCGVIVTDINSCIQIMNPVAETLTGWRQNEAFGKNLAEVFTLSDQDTGEVIDIATQVIEAGTVVKIPENCVLIAKNGTKISVGDSVSPIWDDGKITGTVLVFQDITQRKQVEAHLLRNAFYDALTELPNRVLFLDRLRQTFERGKRRKNYHFAVLFVDLDGFKRVNDNFGHGIGDDLLVAIARRLESSLRGGDTVARFGGDEFAVLLDDIKDVTDATNVAKRIQDTLRLPLYINGHRMYITASIGIALNSGNHEQPENLLRDADIAMYRAKQQGKARYIVFDFHKLLS